jgi:hypothetical protein
MGGVLSTLIVNNRLVFVITGNKKSLIANWQHMFTVAIIGISEPVLPGLFF